MYPLFWQDICFYLCNNTEKIDKRSIGELFYVSCNELQDLQYMDALIMVLKELVFGITGKGFSLKMN